MSESLQNKESRRFTSTSIGLIIVSVLCIVQILMLGYHHFQSKSNFEVINENRFFPNTKADTHEVNADLSFARDRFMDVPFERDVPEFFEGIDENTKLNSAEIRQFRSSAMYKRFGNEEIVRSKLNLAKEDGVLTVGEYYEIRGILSDLRFIESSKKKSQIEIEDAAIAKKELEKL